MMSDLCCLVLSTKIIKNKHLSKTFRYIFQCLNQAIYFENENKYGRNY